MKLAICRDDNEGSCIWETEEFSDKQSLKERLEELKAEGFWIFSRSAYD